jgi:hypothetical protein
VIVCCEHTVKTTVSDIGLLFTVSAGGRRVSHSRLTDWLDNTAPESPLGTPGWTLNCGDRLRRTGRTAHTRLRIRRLGVRVPPSAPASQATGHLRS